MLKTSVFAVKKPLKIFQASVSLDPHCDISGKSRLEMCVLALALMEVGRDGGWDVTGSRRLGEGDPD